MYIWFDTVRKMFYLGSHAGHVDDGYTASSVRCQRAIKKRPEVFRRKILARVSGTRQELLAEETRWLQMIKIEELGKRYYNLKRVATGGNVMESKTAEEIDQWRKKVSVGGKLGWQKSKPGRREKTKATAFGGNTFDRGYMKTEQYSATMSEACLGEKNGFYGKTHSEHTRKIFAEKIVGRCPNSKRFVFTKSDGTELQVKNLQGFMAQNGGGVKLTRFLKSGEPIHLRNKRDHPLTGWKVRYATH